MNTQDALQAQSSAAIRNSSAITTLDFFRLFSTRAKAFFFILALTLAGTFSIFLFTKPEYESQAVIAVQVYSGNVPTSLKGLVPTMSSIVEGVIESYDVKNRFKVKRVLPVLQSVKYSGDLLFLSSRGDTPEDSLKFMKLVTAELIQGIIVPFDKARLLQQEVVDEQQTKVKAMSDQVDKLLDPKQSLDVKDPSLAAILSVERGKIYERLITLQGQYHLAKQELLALQSNTVKVLREPQVVKGGKAAVPSLSLHIIIGVLLGLFFASCAVVALQIIDSVKRDRSVQG